MINDLPGLLIFDDIERCEMPIPEILGLLNSFVEHKAKNVVICGFIERNQDSDEGKKQRELFLTLKEKVVGRTVRIVADVDSALPELIRPMPDGHGKRWFQSNNELVIEVFTSAKHCNLRVLRQCIHDCGRVINVLEEDLRVSNNAMLRFVTTYLALSMAVATGKLNAQELGERGNHKHILEPDEGGSRHPLYECHIAHPHAEIFAGNSANILPLELGVSLIGIGYEEPKKINAALRATKQFSGTSEVPLWRRIVDWHRMPSDKLACTQEAVRSYVLEGEKVEPGPYLLLAHILVFIAVAGDENAEKIAMKIVERIDALSELGKIPGAKYGIEYGWDFERGFSFGGYNFSPEKLTEPLVDAMQRAQLAAFENSMADEADRLLTLLDDDLEAFEREFSWQGNCGNYHRTEILHMIDASAFAKAVFAYLASGKFEAIGATLLRLADRHTNSGNFAKEIEWSKAVRDSLYAQAEKAGPIEKARMGSFFAHRWRFQDNSNKEA